MDQVAAPPEVIVIGLPARVAPVVPSCVIVKSLCSPKERIAPSDVNEISSPTNKSANTPAPPFTINAPVIDEVLAVVSIIFKLKQCGLWSKL